MGAMEAHEDSSSDPRLWYERLSGLKVDLVGDYAGKELFAIHGDQLMAYCLSRAKVDYHSGFQLAHAVYAVEKFLNELEQRGCQFHVLWFTSHEAHCVPVDVRDIDVIKYKVTRAILVEHLRRGIDGQSRPAISHQFQSVDCSRFREYLDANAVQFFLVSDGRMFSARKSDERFIQSLEIMRDLNQIGYSIALLDDVEISSSKIRTTVFSPSLACKRLPAKDYPARSPTTDWKWPPYSLLSCCEGSGTPSGREALAMGALFRMLGTSPTLPTDRRFIAALLLHLVFLRHSKLIQRSSIELATVDSKGEEFLHSFLLSCLDIIRDWALPAMTDFAVLKWDLFDMVDGRVFYCIVSKLESIVIPASLASEVSQLADRVHKSVGIYLTDLLPKPDSTKVLPGLGGHHLSDGETSVLPFSHPILDDFFQSVKLKPLPAMVTTLPSTIFEDLKHWHVNRPFDSKGAAKSLPFFVRRANQRLMAATIAYSASLSNASGKIIKPETIVVPQQSVPAQGAPSQAAPGWKATLKEKTAAKKSKQKKNGASGIQKALEEARSLKAGKLALKTSDLVESWSTKLARFEDEADLMKRYTLASQYESGLTVDDQDIIGAEVSLYICNILAFMLSQPSIDCKRADVLPIIFKRIVSIDSERLPQSYAAELRRFAQVLHLPLEKVSQPSKDNKALPFRRALSKTSDSPIPDIRQFQLESCGPYMERGFDSRPDPRVPFHPDAWQRQVLDATDADKSLFVVAPTSAGKTFISFYAMKKVMKASDDDVLVYVAPTKALVNQIAAEVQARFAKSYRQDGRSVWAIHSRDYRINNPTGCQVLVTVPHILQIMLLSASTASRENSWSSRIKRIIFDEVHCIGQAEDGIVWEQLLLMAPCPIIALSATVGNPDEFRDWLEGSQRFKGLELETIVHSARYSDLRKYVYSPSAIPATRAPFQGLKPSGALRVPGLDGGEDRQCPFSAVNPVASIVNVHRGTLEDITLEPRDCLVLWKLMTKFQTEAFPIDAELSPEKSLPVVIKKSDVLRWESALKSRLLEWMSDGDSPFRRVQQELRAHLGHAHDAEDTSWVQCGSGSHERAFTLEDHFPLLLDLHQHGGLPAIVFNYDRVACENIMFSVLGQLETAEENWKEGGGEWKRTMDDYKAFKKSESKKSSKASSGTPMSKADAVREKAEVEASTWESFDPDAPLEQFSFADPKKLRPSELQEIVDGLKWTKIDPRYIAGLQRGLGVHHAGMALRYRQAVEMLCRKGFLTVVVATGTLALGINVPCRTVVFSGDSVFLSALNYRQSSGRAGRRGFDLLGNVVFTLPPQRVFEIMSSKLPDLRGHFPLSTSLVLRLLSLSHHTQNGNFVANMAQSLLSQTRLYLGGPAGEMAIKHHLRFSVEYLRRQQLLSEAGAPLNFSGLVCHLYFTENAVFAFHSLMKAGYFHKLCAGIDSNPSKVLLDIMLVLSHLFGRIPCVRYKDETWRKGVVAKSTSIVLLPTLPKDAHAVLQQHNQETLEIFKNYVQSFVRQHLSDKPDCELPFTKHRVGAAENIVSNYQPQQETSAVVASLLGGVGPGPSPELRSPFAALSGLTDSFASIRELCSTVRAGVFLEESAVPYTPIYPEDTDGVPWNAYLYDFYKHGSTKALVDGNGIKDRDVWFLLKDFSLILATIVASLWQLLDLEAAAAGNDAGDMIDVQDVADRMEEEMFGGPLDGSGDDELEGEGAAVGKENRLPGASSAAKQLKLNKKAKKKKVADSWDDDLDHGDDNSPSNEEQQKDEVEKDKAQSHTPSAPKTWVEDHGQSLAQVFRAFSKLQEEFDEKFKKTWA